MGPREFTKLKASDFIHWLAQEKSARKATPHVTLFFQSILRSYARSNWGEYSKQGVFDQIRLTLGNSMLEMPLTSVSIVTACMNRNAHLLRSIQSWLKVQSVAEIIIVDYASDQLVANTLSLAGIDDKRVKVFRHQAECWHLAKAFNLGFSHATGAYILKLDSDTIINTAIPSSLALSDDQFKSGNWRTFNTNVLNGIFLARKDYLDRIGGYNEQIRRYGWDDCDLYERLSSIPLVKTDFNEEDFTSIEHSNDERVANGDEKALQNEINTLIQGNRILANFLPKWTGELSRKLMGDNDGLYAENTKKCLDALDDLSYRLAKIQNGYLYGELRNEEYPTVLRSILEELEHPREEARDNSLQRIGQSTQSTTQSHDRSTHTILFTTLYEESNPVRRHELIQCLRINICYFDEVRVLYEDKADVQLEDCDRPVLAELNKLVLLNGSDKARAFVAVIPIDTRPTFATFFEEIEAYQSNNPTRVCWLTIANSDIYFDSSIRLLDKIPFEISPVICLSRWEPLSDRAPSEASLALHTDQYGVHWSLIQSSVNSSISIPNYLSADSWIIRELPKDYHSYDYKIGTYFCDSFFANRAFLNGEYVINPCLDIRCFHLHDPAHNSSATKFADKEQINLLYQAEKTKLGGIEPVAGVPWSTLLNVGGRDLIGNSKPFRWREDSLLINIRGGLGAMNTIILIDLALLCSQGQNSAVYVNISAANYTAEELKLVDDFCKWLNNDRLNLVCIPAHLSNLIGDTADTSFLSAIKDSLQLQRIDPIVSIIEVNKTIYFDDLTDQVGLELGLLSNVLSLPSADFIKKQGTEYGDRFTSEMALALDLRGSFLLDETRKDSSFTLITSVFRAMKYLPGLILNFEAILSLGECELIMIDANADDEDQRLVDSCLSGTSFRNKVNYIRICPDPGIYNCWMLGVEHAQYEFVSNFNADDRRAPLHPHLLSRYLRDHSDCDVCFTGIRPVYEPNIPWHKHLTGESWFSWYKQEQHFLMNDFVANIDGVITSRNIAHCMPMWRKRIHDELGPFREDLYGTSADWAFWLECLKCDKKLILADPRPWGLYYINPNSHNRINDSDGDLENRIIRDYFGVVQKAHIQQ